MKYKKYIKSSWTITSDWTWESELFQYTEGKKK